MKVALSIMGVVCLLLPVGCGESGKLRVVSQLSSPLGLASANRLDIGGILTIERVRLAVGELEFEGGKDEERESELGAALIEVAVDGSATQVAAKNVDAGKYEIIGVGLKPGGDGDRFADFRDPKASILVEGTYDGIAFTWRSNIKPEAEFPIDPPINVPANGEASVSISFDVAAWFTAADGAALDPTDSANQTVIEEAIMASLRASAVEFEKDGDNDKK